jgi:hypothetical protein
MLELRHELAERSELAALEEAMRQGDAAPVQDSARLRAFRRFECDFPAQVKIPATEEDPVEVELDVRIRDISAGGVKAVCPHMVKSGSVAFVSIPHGSCEVIFPARVAWMRAGEFGLMFAGAARVFGGKGHLR